MKVQFRKIALASVVLVFSVFEANAQEGAYTGSTPYSVFGVGELTNPGNAYNKSMGGVGIATRNRKFVNYVNPASITERDSLSFMADFGVYTTSKIYEQDGTRNCSNNTNINDIVISFPVYKTLAAVLGIAPYSSSGYGFVSSIDDPSLIGATGTISNTTVGQGTINQLFAGMGVMFWNKLSIGAEYIHYFGDISRTSLISFSNSSYNGISSGYNLQLRGSTAKLGLQYIQPVGKDKITFGATYTFSAAMRGEIEDYQFSSGSVLTDTLRYNVENLSASTEKSKFASEIGVGISYSHLEKFRVELNYLRSDWTSCGMNKYGFKSESEGKVFSPAVKESFRGGFEYTPNANDIRYYFRRCTYRFGAYYNKEYYKMNGGLMDSKGVTVGMTLPVANINNAITLGLDFGRRGKLSGGLIRENYMSISIGVNVYDIWFLKHQYQ